MCCLALSAVPLYGGCGSSEGGDTSEARSTPASDAVPPGGEAAIVRIFDRWQADFIAGDGQAVCGRLARAGKAEIAKLDQYLPNIPAGASCEQTVRAIVRTSRETGSRQKPSKAISARIRGARATAMVSDAGRQPQPVPFVVEGGEWKLASAGFASYLESVGAE